MSTDNKETETKQCTIPSVSGSISIYDYNAKQGFKEIVFKTDWTKDAESFTVEYYTDSLVIKKWYLEVPKKARKITKKGHLIIKTEAPSGTFEIDEESTEDELVVYYC